MTKTADTPITPAASIVIIRDGQAGLEVFMMERNQGAGMAFSGHFVFPGGKVDNEDRADVWQRLAPKTATAPDRAFWIASVRETFEEAGLLLARKPGAEHVVGADEARRLVASERDQPRQGRSARFAEMLGREGLELAIDQMIYFGHWITPTWAPKRFDTHFFLTAAPMEQRENFDRTESSEAVWIAPREALRQADAGTRQLVAVTRFKLELLNTWPNVATALAAAGQRKVVTVLPRMEDTPEGKMLKIPPEAGYIRSEMLARGR